MCDKRIRFKRIKNDLLNHLEDKVMEKLKGLISFGIDRGYSKLISFIDKKIKKDY